jgi:hypothetical protein
MLLQKLVIHYRGQACEAAALSEDNGGSDCTETDELCGTSCLSKKFFSEGTDLKCISFDNQTDTVLSCS